MRNTFPIVERVEKERNKFHFYQVFYQIPFCWFEKGIAWQQRLFKVSFVTSFLLCASLLLGAFHSCIFHHHNSWHVFIFLEHNI